MRYSVIAGCALVSVAVVSASTTTPSSSDQKRKSCLGLVDAKKTAGFEESYSKFASTLSANCDSVDIKSLKDKSVVVKKYGEFIYTDIFLGVFEPSKFSFPTESAADLYESPDKYRQTTAELHSTMKAAVRHNDESTSGLAIEDLVDFVDNGKNLLIAVQGKSDGSSASAQLKKFLSEFGFGIDSSAVVVDYFGGGGKSNNTELITSAAPLATEPWTSLISGKKTVLYRGSPIAIDQENLNVYPIIRAGETASHPNVSGQGLSLVLGAAHQTLNGARVVLLGSLEMLSNEFFTKNSDAISHIVSWSFGNRGVLQISDFFHHRVGETRNPRMYREKDEVVVGAKFEELVGRNKWVPYTAGDIQIEYVMLDPHIRDFLKYDSGKKMHELFFKVPDVYGIFKFKIAYNRLGYNPIKFEQVAPVRNYRHNDYERFLFCAYPYYASCFVSLVMVAIVSVVFLNHKDKKGGAAATKDKRHRE